MNLVQTLVKKGLVSPPKWLPENIHYLSLMGSEAYGAKQPDSDRDVYGFCIPPKDVVFPPNVIPGFGAVPDRFDSWQEHHIKDHPMEWDITVFSIVRYFHLCMDCNPNMIDSLFTNNAVVMTQTKIGQMVRENRRMFLSAKAWHSFKGYAYSQLHKMSATNRENPKRQHDIDTYGYDLKFGYHVVRLMLQVEQILLEGDLDLTRNAEVIKSIRRGEWPKEKVTEFFDMKERQLEEAYSKTKLPYKPREAELKVLLLQCLEEHYGNLPVKVLTQTEKALEEMAEVLRKYGKV